jgi:superoxide reductase
MAEFNELFQSADWKAEKHVPVIEAPAAVKKGEFFEFTVVVGKEIPHPNKTEHHIRWVAAFFQPDGSKFPYEIGRMEFAAHGESAEGPDTSTVYTHPAACMNFKTDKPGTIHASSYCNIHGLWLSSKRLDIAK